MAGDGPRGAEIEERVQQTRIPKVDLGRFHLTLADILVPGLELAEHERRRQDVQVPHWRGPSKATIGARSNAVRTRRVYWSRAIMRSGYSSLFGVSIRIMKRHPGIMAAQWRGGRGAHFHRRTFLELGLGHVDECRVELRLPDVRGSSPAAGAHPDRAVSREKGRDVESVVLRRAPL